MATGTWEDFTDKDGFSDGEGVDQRDFEARARLVEKLNDHEAMKAAGLHALEYDRPGLHNPCLVVVVKGQAKAVKELLKLWRGCCRNDTRCQGPSGSMFPGAGYQDAGGCSIRYGPSGAKNFLYLFLLP